MTTAAIGVDAEDFYHFESLLDDSEREILARVRDFMTDRVQPLLLENWSKAQFPHEILPGFAGLGIAGLPYQGHGCAGRSFLLDGMIAMELARTDASIATFHGVHSGLAMGSIALCGDEEQRERYLPRMARLELIGSFGLTEPGVGSGAAGGLQTTARRDGDEWVLDGAKKWIGNAPIGHVTVIWARDEADGRVRGFIVRNDSPGFTIAKQEHKFALRIVQNGEITLCGVRVPEEDRLQNADSFADTASVLRMTRAGVAWMAVGCARGAYENALRYAVEREQFGRPIGGFQLVQDLLVRMLGNITTSWGMCARLSQLQDRGEAGDRHSSLAKAVATVRMRETVGWARELMGGNGILLEHNVGRFVADAEAIYSYEGTREMNTLIVGKAITGLSAFA
ncbi:acyl-CoA dehydrogenase family protein [Tsukamurella sp. 8F]|uniref:acyl-CoA dehydrogenase family protein n=1 Tax=unclassified Tsukamurella TaxID=2633480 RepID=UPI0023B9E070|nr:MULTISPECIES: acyl-CoA dehydrogenase family protein [unclassified Tsukamurella]MDF0532609.1 acyl-CoA dehydrogenase family protein [Tsukamurella sp. 8J]MDF0589142.1 acyl-CoA dehydrogenase family protein [Tsukamurella sp. 8F]